MAANNMIDAAEVAKHHMEHDCWVIINGNVWDVTTWIREHPGGKQAIFQFAGKDASAAYNRKHPTNLVYEKLLWRQALKGRVAPKKDSQNSATKKKTSKKVPALPQELSTPPPPQEPSPSPTPQPMSSQIPQSNGNSVAEDTDNVVPADMDEAESNYDSAAEDLGSAAPLDVDDPAYGDGPVVEDTDMLSVDMDDPAHDEMDNEGPMPDFVPEYKLRMSHGWTVTDGTFDPIPQDRRRKRDVPYPSYVGHTFRTRSALSSLQISRNAPIKADALEVALSHLWKCMPEEVRRFLHIAPPNGPELWGPDDEARNALYEEMEKKVYHILVKKGSKETVHRFFADITKRPWVIMPLWVEDEWGSDWIIVVWFAQALPKQIDYFNQIISFGIFDSRRSEDPDFYGRHLPIQERLENLRIRLYEFWGKAGYNVENASVMEVFSSPMPPEEATSGERGFAVVKGLISQIIDWYTEGKQFSPFTTIKSMPQWVNPYQQRVELTGINAWTLMASLDYNARITVEALLPNTRTEVAADGEKRFIYNYDLAGPYHEPPIAAHDYCLPGGMDYKTPPGKTKPNTFWEYAYEEQPDN